MSDISDEDWEEEATKMCDQITEIIDGKDSDMIIEVLACVVAALRRRLSGAQLDWLCADRARADYFARAMV